MASVVTRRPVIQKLGACMHHAVVKGSPRVETFGPEHSEVYEDVYRARGKDWAREAQAVVNMVRERCPAARSLLDVACGVGSHLESFRSMFDDVVGVELSPDMRERAVRRLQGIEIREGDMRDFDLGRTFDAVTCLFTAVAFLPSVTELRRACAAMAAHLAPGGVLVVEPWWLPEQFLPDYIGSDLVQNGDRTIARMSNTVRDGPVAHMEVEWIVGERGRGLRTFSEVERFYMFTREELLAAIDEAGCEPEFQDKWLSGHSLALGVRRR